MARRMAVEARASDAQFHWWEMRMGEAATTNEGWTSPPFGRIRL